MTTGADPPGIKAYGVAAKVTEMHEKLDEMGKDKHSKDIPEVGIISSLWYFRIIGSWIFKSPLCSTFLHVV